MKYCLDEPSINFLFSTRMGPVVSYIMVNERLDC